MWRKTLVGKKIGNAIYIHKRYINQLDSELKVLYKEAEAQISPYAEKKWNLIKINKIKKCVSFLNYPRFDLDAHPELEYYIHIKLDLYNPRSRIVKGGGKILHRKELFIGKDYPLYDKFSKLTIEEEKLGLLEINTIFRGHKLGRIMGQRGIWEEWLESNRVSIIDHKLTKI